MAEEKVDKLRVVLDWQVSRQRKRKGKGGVLRFFFWLLMAAILLACIFGLFKEFMPSIHLD